MAHEVVLGDPKIYVAEFDLTADMTQHEITQTIDLPDDTSYGDTFRQRLIGVRDAQFTLGGFIEWAGATDIDTVLNSKMGTADVPVILCGGGAAVGDPAEFGLINQGQYTQVAKYGDLGAFTLNGMISDRKWIRGRVLWTPATAITGTADGTEVELGAVAAGQSLYVAMAVSAATVTSVTVKVQSDTTGFPSATDRVTFTAFTDVTSEQPTPVAGAITDTYYRASISAFTGTTATAIVVAGIQ